MAEGEAQKSSRPKAGRGKRPIKRAETADTPEKVADAKRKQRDESLADDIKRRVGRGVIVT